MKLQRELVNASGCEVYAPDHEGDIEVYFGGGSYGYINARKLYAALHVHFYDNPLSLQELGDAYLKAT